MINLNADNNTYTSASAIIIYTVIKTQLSIQDHITEYKINIISI